MRCPNCRREVKTLKIEKGDILTTELDVTTPNGSFTEYPFYKADVIVPEGMYREICYLCGHIFSDGKVRQ